MIPLPLRKKIIEPSKRALFFGLPNRFSHRLFIGVLLLICGCGGPVRTVPDAADAPKQMLPDSPSPDDTEMTHPVSTRNIKMNVDNQSLPGSSICEVPNPTNHSVYRFTVSQKSRFRVVPEESHYWAEIEKLSVSTWLRRVQDDTVIHLSCKDGSWPRSTILQAGDYELYIWAKRHADFFSDDNQELKSIYEIKVEWVSTQTQTSADGPLPSDIWLDFSEYTRDLSVDTFSRRDDLVGSCGGKGGPDGFIPFELKETSDLMVTTPLDFRGGTFPPSTLNLSYTPVFYLLKKSDGAPEELACEKGLSLPILKKQLPPGKYYLVLDGQTETDFGKFELSIRTRSVKKAEEACKNAPFLPFNKEKITVLSGEDNFVHDCGAGNWGEDIIYKLRVPEKMRVSVQAHTHYKNFVYIRRQCVDPGNPSSRSAPTQVESGPFQSIFMLEPGTWFLIVDSIIFGGDDLSLTVHSTENWSEGFGAGAFVNRNVTQIKLGAPIVQGAISKEVIRRIAHRHLDEVQLCYQAALSKTPNLEGRTSIKYIINDDGNVQMAAVANSTLENVKIENCVAKVVRKWVFPPPDGGIVVVTQPFILTSSE